MKNEIILTWNWLKENQGQLMFITTFVLVVITFIYVLYTKGLVETAQKQLQLQLSQYQFDNRPSVFISGWGEFQKFKNIETIRFTLKNVGKLPAKFSTIEYKIIIGDKTYDIDSKDFSNPTVIFPSQENMHIDLPVPLILMPIIKNNLGFNITLRMTYYSINDIKKGNQFFYSVKYLLRMNNPNSETIDEYILQEIDAK
ncbi:MAG: hypothetical protein Q8S54_15065 [Bacteroidota bacterium]|nr:hypothetical protein [Odoribacter sp.]MDP3644497.1 hypothetical protein [Bacteroidota bacterium]